ncbi:MAG TPA: TetR/AcrR family transcriptional regulator [Candidatus Angelobacter sp.]|jgi:AcrR family transcriptional regulator
MSGKKPTWKKGAQLKLKAAAKPKADRRALRTRNVLGDALVELIQQRPFHSIKVQDVLDRAGVSRSTFYSHYRDKEDLFLSDVEDFWEMLSNLIERSGEQSQRVAPVQELFAHVAEAKSFVDALTAAGKIHDVMEQGRGEFARAIEKRLLKLNQLPGAKTGTYAAQAHGLAGALFSMLNWWIDRGMPVSAAEMDETFHRLVWSGVEKPGGAAFAKPAPSASH